MKKVNFMRPALITISILLLFKHIALAEEFVFFPENFTATKQVTNSNDVDITITVEKLGPLVRIEYGGKSGNYTILDLSTLDTFLVIPEKSQYITQKYHPGQRKGFIEDIFLFDYENPSSIFQTFKSEVVGAYRGKSIEIFGHNIDITRNEATGYLEKLKFQSVDTWISVDWIDLKEVKPDSDRFLVPQNYTERKMLDRRPE